MWLFLATCLSFVMLVSSFFIDTTGGLYTHSYLAEDDLYKISELQGAGASDDILLVLGSLLLFLVCTITLLTLFGKKSLQSYLFLTYLVISTYIFQLMETSDFLEISYATIILAKNSIYTLWFCSYLFMIVIVVYAVFTTVEKPS